MVKTKTCNCCFKLKSIGLFGVVSAHVDGLSYFCKACKQEKDKAYRNSSKGKEKRANYAKSGRGKFSVKKYRDSEKGVSTRKLYEERPCVKEAIKKRLVMYRNTAKGKTMVREANAKYYASKKEKNAKA